MMLPPTLHPPRRLRGSSRPWPDPSVAKPFFAPPAFLSPLVARWKRLPGNLRGGIWMLLGGLEMSTAMAIAKDLTDEIHAFELNFFRCLFGLIALVPFLMGSGWAITTRGFYWKNCGSWISRGMNC